MAKFYSYLRSGLQITWEAVYYIEYTSAKGIIINEKATTQKVREKLKPKMKCVTPPFQYFQPKAAKSNKNDLFSLQILWENEPWVCSQLRIDHIE